MLAKHLQATTHKEPWTLFKVINLVPIILLAIVVSVVMWLWHRMQDPMAYPVRHVEITTKGNYIPQNIIKDSILENTHGGFFSLDTGALKQGLLSNPWIQSVSIRRVWPNTLSVDLTEQQPFAKWGDGGVLTAKGDIFYPEAASIPQYLLQIEAPLVAKNGILAFIEAYQQKLKSLNMSIDKLSVSKRLAWTVLLNNGIEVSLCRDQVQQRFATFLDLYPSAIGSRAQNVVSVNLCYPNGLSIQWREGKST